MTPWTGTAELEDAALGRLLDRVRSARVAVLGDFCLDAYLFLDHGPSETAGDARPPISEVREQLYSPGGAANVAANCATLGAAQVETLGVVGGDPYGSALRRLLLGFGVGTRGLLHQPLDWHTRVHTRIVQHGIQIGRMDFGNYNTLASSTGCGLLKRLESLLPTLDVVVINQQLRAGVHTAVFRSSLRELMRRAAGALFVVDSRHHSDEYPGAVRKLNDREAVALCGVAQSGTGPVPLEASCRAAGALRRRWGSPVVVTRGEHGSLVADGVSVRAHPALWIAGPVDTVGAGDSYLAGLAMALGVGADIDAAARLGSLVAAVTVGKLHTAGTADPEEVMAVAAHPVYSFGSGTVAQTDEAARPQGGGIVLAS